MNKQTKKIQRTKTGTKENLKKDFFCTFCTVRMPNEFNVEVFTLNVIQNKQKNKRRRKNRV